MGREGEKRLRVNVKQESHQSTLSAVLSGIAHCNHLKKKIAKETIWQDNSFVS